MITKQELLKLIKKMPPMDEHMNVVKRKDELTKLYNELQTQPNEVDRLYVLGAGASYIPLSIVRAELLECYAWLSKNYNSWLMAYNARKRAVSSEPKTTYGPITTEEVKMLSHYHGRYALPDIARMMNRTEHFILEQLQQLINKRA